MSGLRHWRSRERWLNHHKNHPANLSAEKREKVTSWESSVKLVKLFRYVVCPTDEA
jgi:hypothetical protein